MQPEWILSEEFQIRYQQSVLQEPVRYADHLPAVGSHLRRRLHRKETGRSGNTRRRYDRNSPQDVPVPVVRPPDHQRCTGWRVPATGCGLFGELG